MMGKVLLALCIISLAFLGIGTALASSDAVFWLASGAFLYQKVRIILIVFLLMQFVTNPPRHLKFRIATGMIAGIIGVWTIQATYEMSMPALDTFAFLSASIALMVTALERKVSLDSAYGLTSRNGLETNL